MMELRHPIAAGALAATCSDALAPLARAMLATLAERDRAGPALQEGSRVQFGWSTLTLHRDGDALRLHQPDFGTGSPTRLDPTLSVIHDQAALLRQTGLLGEDARWDAHVILVPPTVLQAPHLFLRRMSPTDADDSGWLIGDADDPPADDTRAAAVQVFRLLTLRPFLLRLLALPADSFARVRGDRIEEITDPAGRDRPV